MRFPRFLILALTCALLLGATGLLLGKTHKAKPAPTPTPKAQSGYVPARYVVTLGNITAWRIISQKYVSNRDTDFVSLAIETTGQPKFAKGYGPYKFQNNQSTDLKLASDPILLSDPDSKMTVGWVAVNSGTSNTQKLISKLNDIAEQIGESVPNIYSQIISFIAGHIVGYVATDCDAPLFGGNSQFTGAQLATRAVGPPWHPEGKDGWSTVFDYPNIPGGCSTGHYNLEVHIQKVP